MLRPRVRLAGAGLFLLGACTSCVRTFSTDIPVNYQQILEQKYVGRSAWTRATLQDEKKNVKIEQDEEITIVALGMQRTGGVTLVAKKGHKRLVFPFHLARPLTLETYEKTLLDYLWTDPPDVRFEKLKKEYGTRVAESIRDHKVLKQVSQYVAYLSWGAPTSVVQPEGTTIERWQYDTANLANSHIDFLGGKVATSDGENVGDTEAAKKKKSIRRGGGAETTAEKKK